MAKEIDNSEGATAYNILSQSGYKVVYCDGPIYRNNGIITTETTEAVTAPDGTVYVSSDATLPGVEISLHEVVHISQNTNLEAYTEYESVLCENINLTSEGYREVAKQINANNFGGKYDIDNIDDWKPIMRELSAYINQYVITDPSFAETIFSNMFEDWGAVKEATKRFNQEIGIDYSNIESASEERAPFREPSTKEIYRDSTSEEKYEAMLGERKDAKQRHITDIAKKLDSSLRLIWVDKNSDKLKGKNGKYVRATNTMYIAKDVSVVEMYVEVFKHEFVHRLESRSSYKSFKDYLFKHSTAFEQYVRGLLGINNKGKPFEGNRAEALKALTEYYYNQFVNDTTIAKNLRDRFTMEAAEREIVADFAGDILFKGKENRADIAQTLSEDVWSKKDIRLINNTESSMDALEEIANTDRSLLQKIIDIIKDFIRILQGNPQTKRLVEDLEYIENRLARVYDSKDSKRAINNAPGEQHKLINNQFPAFNESQSDANEWATRWAQSENVETGDQKLASYHNRWYLIEKFDDVEFGYRIIERLNKKKYEELKGEIGNVRDTKGTSVEGASIRISSSVGRETKLTGRNYDVNSDSDKYSREDNKIQRVGAGESRFNRTKENYSISDRESSQLNSEESGDTEVQLEDEGQYSVGSPLQRMRETVASKNKSQYDEFNSNVMQWAYSASTKTGDMKIFNRRGKEFVLIEATEDGYIEHNNGNYKGVSELYERVHAEKDRSIYEDTQTIRSEQNSNMWDMQYARKGRNATRNAESTRSKEFQSDTAGNDEYLRSGDKGVNEPLDEEQYSVGSPLQQMRDNLSKYDSDEINDEEYYSENDRLWGEAIETYGKKSNAKKEDFAQVNPQLCKWLAIINAKSSNNSITEKQLTVNNNTMQ